MISPRFGLGTSASAVISSVVLAVAVVAGIAPVQVGRTQPAPLANEPAKQHSTSLAPAQAIFYEEQIASVMGSPQEANLAWRLLMEPLGQDLSPQPAAQAIAVVPDNGLTMTMTIRRNADLSLAARHIIELAVAVPPDFPDGGIESIGHLLLKPTEQTRGEPLIGSAAKILDDFFIFALSDQSEAAQHNLRLLSNNQWIDIPLVYSSGRRALMSIDKGLAGGRFVDQALGLSDLE